jgi:L-alanine-DL-glutamate epimerase-like enolase superfamily enzyme
MHEQIRKKLAEGFRCIKMKIGAIDFGTELSLLASIRKKYTEEQIELRVDANGAFEPADAMEKLERLSRYDLHSIEQPIRQGNPGEMKHLCEKSPIPIALDEELIGISDVTEKEKLLLSLRPQYLILKPSLVGGYSGSREWIGLAEKYGIGWWVTSALESNIGLNAIAQWTYTLGTGTPQGLGTGSLFTNNFECPLEVEEGKLFYRGNKYWETDLIKKLCT